MWVNQTGDALVAYGIDACSPNNIMHVQLNWAAPQLWYLL